MRAAIRRDSIRLEAGAAKARGRRGARCPAALAGLVLGLSALPAVAADPAGSLRQVPGAAGCIADDPGEVCRDADFLHGAFGVTLSHDGRNAYVPLISGQGVAALSRDARTGALKQLAAPQGCTTQTGHGGLCATGRGLDAPQAVVVTRDGRHAYAVSQQRDPVTISSLALFSRDPATGALTQLAGDQGCISDVIAGCTPAIGVGVIESVAVSPDGKHVYTAAVGSDSVAVFARHPVSGVLTQLPEPQGCISQSGSGGHCTQGRALDGARHVIVSRDGKFVYVASEQSRAVAVFSRNKTTGVLTQLPGEAGCIAQAPNAEGCTDAISLRAVTSLAISKNGKSLYAASASAHHLAVLARDKRTGALSYVQCLQDEGSVVCESVTALRQPYSIAVSDDNRNVYVAARESHAVAAFSRDLKTGTLTQLPSLDGCVSDDGSEGLCSDGRALRIPRAVTVSRDGKHVYVAAQGSHAVAVLKRKR
jgi:6-phosphogluconolactonase (cycloisomerase 2 family)